MGEKDATADARIHYVVTVHGMGESREFETSRLVANLFGTALKQTDYGQGKPTPPEPRVSLGTAGGIVHSGEKLWVEFAGVPQPGEAAGPFTGLPATDQLRFVDFAWNEVSRTAFEHHGEAPEDWAASVLARMDGKDPPPPVWVKRMLGQVRSAVLVMRRLLVGKLAGAGKTAFDDYLGDVQMYGDYVPARGRAVRQFHQEMAAVHAAHEAEFPEGPAPTYTILAHSLGTVVALDALMAAHKIGAVDYPDYGTDNPPARDWAEHVQSFVTLGSPIDKFLLIWWYRFDHMADPSGFSRTGKKVRHFNYCDEQDPVGHNLDIAADSPGFQAVFETIEDRVFNRYDIPGQAHLGYFKDVELFQWIYARAVAGTRPNTGPPWFVPAAYRSLLRFTYFLIPLAVVLLNTGLFVWAWTADGLVQCVVASTAFLGTWWLGRMLIDLSIWWRQIQRAKWRHFDHEDPGCDEHLRDQRKKPAAHFRRLLWLRMILFLVLLTAATAFVRLPIKRVATILAAILAGWALWRFILFPGAHSGPNRKLTKRLARQDWLTICIATVAILVGWTLGRTFDPPGRGHEAFLYVAVLVGNAFVVSLYVLLSMYHCKDDLKIKGKESDAREMKSATSVVFTDYRG